MKTKLFLLMIVVYMILIPALLLIFISTFQFPPNEEIKPKPRVQNNLDLPAELPSAKKWLDLLPKVKTLKKSSLSKDDKQALKFKNPIPKSTNFPEPKSFPLRTNRSKLDEIRQKVKDMLRNSGISYEEGIFRYSNTFRKRDSFIDGHLIKGSNQLRIKKSTIVSIKKIDNLLKVIVTKLPYRIEIGDSYSYKSKDYRLADINNAPNHNFVLTFKKVH